MPSLEDQREVEKWQRHITAYERAFADWEKRVKKIIAKYRDEEKQVSDKRARFNILWSNVQTLCAATFAHLPKPDVSRRFRDRDPVGRVASLILERALEYEITHYSDYRTTMRASVLDRYLGGRATAWARYEPHFRAQQIDEPIDGVQVTEDVDTPDEELDYECAPTDYVHWKDFGHVLARTWEEVPAVWRDVYMTRDALIARFGEDDGARVPLDVKPQKDDENRQSGEEASRGLIIEIWDKEEREALWYSPSLGEIIDRRDDPLGLEGFFPCPRPLFATLANDTLVPTPDYAQYQYQAEILDQLSRREEELIDAIRVIGTYDGSIPEIQRIFTEAGNTQMVPITNWAAYAEKGGLTGAVQFTELKPIYEALKNCYIAAEQTKNQIYEITRISDIMRGYVNPEEKLGQSELKSQYGNLGIKAYQEQIAEFATELLQIKAQIMCNKFSPQTLVAISAADQMSDQDKQILPQALQLLLGDRMINPDAETPNPLRSFRVEISSDSLVYMDEEKEKESRMAFIQANSAFMKDALMTLTQSGPAAGPLAPLVMDIWKFGVQGFKVGWQIEGSFDEAIEKLRQLAAQPPPQPQPDPALIKAQHEAQLQQQQQQFEQQKAQQDQQFETAKLQTESQIRQGEMQTQAQIKASQQASDERIAIRKLELEQQTDLQRMSAEDAFKRWQAELEAQTKIDIAKIQVNAKLAASSGDDEVSTIRKDIGEVGKRVDEGSRNVVTGLAAVRDQKGDMTAIRVKRADGSSQDVSVTLH